MLKISPFTIAVKETNYNITLITVGCLTWDEVNTRWDPNKCDVRLIWLYIEKMSHNTQQQSFIPTSPLADNKNTWINMEHVIYHLLNGQRYITFTCFPDTKTHFI